MTQAITLARPYGRAAFEVARDIGALPAWSQALAFAAAVAADPRVAALLSDPRATARQLVELHLPEGMPQGSPFGAFLIELAQRQRLPLLPEIAVIFEELKRRAESQLLVKVTSAMALDAAQAEQLKASLKRRFKRDIELQTRVDPALLGGAVIDAGGAVIDGSVRGRLERLAGALA